MLCIRNVQSSHTHAGLGTHVLLVCRRSMGTGGERRIQVDRLAICCGAAGPSAVREWEFQQNSPTPALAAWFTEPCRATPIDTGCCAAESSPAAPPGRPEHHQPSPAGSVAFPAPHLHHHVRRPWRQAQRRSCWAADERGAAGCAAARDRLCRLCRWLQPGARALQRGRVPTARQQCRAPLRCLSCRAAYLHQAEVGWSPADPCAPRLLG